MWWHYSGTTMELLWYYLGTTLDLGITMILTSLCMFLTVATAAELPLSAPATMANVALHWYIYVLCSIYSSLTVGSVEKKNQLHHQGVVVQMYYLMYYKIFSSLEWNKNYDLENHLAFWNYEKIFGRIMKSLKSTWSKNSLFVKILKDSNNKFKLSIILIN